MSTRHISAKQAWARITERAEHGQKFAAVVQRGGVAGVQFHPEKSGEVGLTILRNFLRLAR